MKNKWIIAIIIAAVCVVGVFVIRQGGSSSSTANMYAIKAPDFSLPTNKNRVVSLHEFREGKPAIIFFWATWCPHCRYALQDFARAQQDFIDQDIKVILVNSAEHPSKVQAYLNQLGINSEVFLDLNDEVAELYEIIGLPTFYFLNKDGMIVDMGHSLPNNYQEILK